jgi:hypothetical protein
MTNWTLRSLNKPSKLEGPKRLFFAEVAFNVCDLYQHEHNCAYASFVQIYSYVTSLEC